MPNTRRGSTRKDDSSHEQSKTRKRGRGQNNLSQEQQFRVVKGGRGRGRGRGKSVSSLTKKKSHPLNEILEDSDYDKDPTESSLSRPFKLLSPNISEVHINTDDLDDLRPRSSDIQTPLREIHRNTDSLSTPSRLILRDLNTPASLREGHRNTDDLDDLRPRSSDIQTPLREIHRNSRPILRDLNTPASLREVHRSTDELDSSSAPSRPRSRNSDTLASLRSFNASASPTLPSCFNDMDTIFQLATWLCANPNVLQFANAIYSSMQTSLTNGQQFAPSNLTNPTTLQLQATKQEDKSKVSRDFLEELKCLFLRVRNPPKHALEELIQQIIKCELNSAEGLEWLRIGNRQFGDFRNKFLDGVERLINSIKEKRYEQGIPVETLPQNEDIKDFVDEEITISLLRRWLNAVKIDELRRENSLVYLSNLVKKAIIFNYTNRDPERTKSLDIITKNITVPSRNGANFASNLQL